MGFAHKEASEGETEVFPPRRNMPISPFMAAINQLADEKGLPKEIVVETIEAAIAAAYRKDYGQQNQQIIAKLNPDTGGFDIKQTFEVVSKVEDAAFQISKTEAQKIKKGAKIGESVEIPLPEQAEFGRIAAQTAKQVILQRLREAERDLIMTEFEGKEKEVIPASIQRIENKTIIVDLGKTTGTMLPSEQIPGEYYAQGQRLKFYIKEVTNTARGPQITVSRADPGFIKGLFGHEVPEIKTNDVEIVGIAREAGFRSKVAVKSHKEGLDPVGSVVGQRGNRIQSVLAEIPNEKIDIILFDPDPATFIQNALSPAKIAGVNVLKTKKTAKVKVNNDQLALAIGKNGQNVRLASKLTGFELDIEEEKKEFRKSPEKTKLETSGKDRQKVKSKTKTGSKEKGREKEAEKR